MLDLLVYRDTSTEGLIILIPVFDLRPCILFILDNDIHNEYWVQMLVPTISACPVAHPSQITIGCHKIEIICLFVFEFYLQSLFGVLFGVRLNKRPMNFVPVMAIKLQ